VIGTIRLSLRGQIPLSTLNNTLMLGTGAYLICLGPENVLGQNGVGKGIIHLIMIHGQRQNPVLIKYHSAKHPIAQRQGAGPVILAVFKGNLMCHGDPPMSEKGMV
jgi:hypothetical protein